MSHRNVHKNFTLWYLLIFVVIDVIMTSFNADNYVTASFNFSRQRPVFQLTKQVFMNDYPVTEMKLGCMQAVGRRSFRTRSNMKSCCTEYNLSSWWIAEYNAFHFKACNSVFSFSISLSNVSFSVSSAAVLLRFTCNLFSSVWRSGPHITSISWHRALVKTAEINEKHDRT